MAGSHFSIKHLEIDKANTTLFIVVAAAAVLTTFSLVAGRSLLIQRSYQNKVIGAKETAVKQLRANVQAVTALDTSYQAFVANPQNIIGGSSTGQGDQDGDNAKIVLDALPSKYDFPALTSSLEKMLVSRNYHIVSINGTDDELTQDTAGADTSLAVEMPFKLNVDGSYDSLQQLLGVLGRSIRPIHIDSLRISGSDTLVVMNIDAKTYYQPEKSLQINKKVVK